MGWLYQLEVKLRGGTQTYDFGNHQPVGGIYESGRECKVKKENGQK